MSIWNDIVLISLSRHFIHFLFNRKVQKFESNVISLTFVININNYIYFNKVENVLIPSAALKSHSTAHRGAFCQFPFRWIYYCHISKSTGKEIGKTHLCGLICCPVIGQNSLFCHTLVCFVIRSYIRGIKGTYVNGLGCSI